MSVDYLTNPDSTNMALEMYEGRLQLYNSIYINLVRNRKPSSAYCLTNVECNIQSSIAVSLVLHVK